MITDKDGSCRDINFDGANWTGVESFIEKIADLYSSLKCQVWQFNEEANEVGCKDMLKNLKMSGASAQIYAEDISNILQQLQIFIFTEDNNQPFLELTFFPQDVNLEPGNIDAFINLVQDWNDILKATKFFVRYENASWKFGDESKYSGVIYTSDMDFA